MLWKEKWVLQLQAPGSGHFEVRSGPAGLLACQTRALRSPGQAQSTELCLPPLSAAHQLLCLHLMGPYSICPGSQRLYPAEFLCWASKQPDPHLQAGFPALHGRPRVCGSLPFLAW